MIVEQFHKHQDTCVWPFPSSPLGSQALTATIALKKKKKSLELRIGIVLKPPVVLGKD